MVGELEAVAEEVGQYLAQPRRVAAHAPRHTAAHQHLEAQAAGFGQRRVAMLDRFEQRMQVEVHRLQAQLAGLYFRQVEDVADDARQGLRAVVDLPQIALAPGLVEPRLARQPGQSDQAIQRRADFVAGVGQEGALGTVGRLGVVARTGQRLVDGAALRHVFGDPDRRALARVGRVNGTGQQPAQEGAAVAAGHRAFDFDRFATRQRGAEFFAHSGVGCVAGPDHSARLTDQRARRPAEHLLELGVGELEGAVAGHGNADRRVLQDRVALQPLEFDGRDIAAVDDQVVAALQHEVRRRDQQQERAAVPVKRFDRLVAHLAALADLLHEALAHLATGPDAEFHGGLADDLVAGPAGRPHEGIVDHHVAAGGQVGQRDQVGAAGDQVRHQRFGALACGLCAQALGVVVVDRQDRRSAVGIDLDAGDLGHDAAPARGAQHERVRRHRLTHRQPAQGQHALGSELA